MVECRICNREIAGSNLSLGYFAPRSTQPSTPLGSVNEYQLRLGRQRQVWLTPIADERVDVQLKLWNPSSTHAIPERFCGGDSLRRGAISSVCTFTFTFYLYEMIVSAVWHMSMRHFSAINEPRRVHGDLRHERKTNRSVQVYRIILSSFNQSVCTESSSAGSKDFVGMITEGRSSGEIRKAESGDLRLFCEGRQRTWRFPVFQLLRPISPAQRCCKLI